MSRSKKEYLVIGLKGMAMGAADIVPGVSGGTIALIAGIYEEFVNALKSFSSAIGVLKNEGLKAAWKHVNGSFLLALFSGIAVSLVSLVQFIKYALENHAIVLWSFFFGLIVASCYFVGKMVSKWNFGSIVALIIGTVAIYLVTSISPAETSTSLWFIFISGMLAICAMILPGISGSFILVLLGKYAYIIESLSEFRIQVAATFAAGCVVGLLSFSHFLSWMLKKYHNLTIALLTGFMIGSLNKIWPWKKTLEWGFDRHGEKVAILEENILPAQYQGENHLWAAIGLALVGFFVIVILEVVAGKKTDQS
jgi:putative membrane protein